MIPTNLVKAMSLLAIGLSSISTQATELIRGPYIQLGTASSMIIRWNTDEPTNSRITYGTQFNELDQILDNAALTTSHEVVLTNLSPLTRYYYSVGSDTSALAGNDADTFFETSPATDTATPTRIWILGDPGRAGTDPTLEGQKIVRDGYYQFSQGAYTDFWLMLGDNAYNDGTIEEYQNAVFDQYPTMLKQSPFWPVMGNHDNRTAKVETGTGGYYDLFSLPKNGEAGGVASTQEAYFSFDYGNIHVVVLNSSDREHYELSGPMDEWLRTDLQTSEAEWLIAVFHHPVYGKSGHDSDTEYNMIQMRQNFVPILEEFGVDLVMTGHNHFYTRTTLIDGHHGMSDTFDTNKHHINAGDGRLDGDGAYSKTSGAANSGTVYITHGAGEGGGSGYARRVTDEDIASGKRHPTDFMYGGRGSMVLEIDGKTLAMNVIGPLGDVVDYFTITHTGDDTSQNQAPNAVANGPYTAEVDEDIIFNSTGSDDPDGNIASYLWYFGEGNASNLPHPTHRYTTAGEYTATLTVTDDKGATDSSQVAVSIIGGADSVLQNGVAKTVSGQQTEELQFVFEVPIDAKSVTVTIANGSGDADLYVRFSEQPTVSDYDCRPYKGGNSEQCDFTPAQTGSYYIMLRGYNPFSEVQLTADYLLDGNEAPAADANGPYHAAVNSDIMFSSDGSFDPDGTLSAYSWDFGDGNQSQQANPIHPYTSEGHYTALLTVTDAQGKTSQDSANVTISNVVDACTNGGIAINGGRVDAGAAYCLQATAGGDQIQLAHLVRDEDVGKVLELKLEYGSGNADLLHRFDQRPDATTWDHRSQGDTNEELILVPSVSKGWHYVHVKATTAFSGATLSLSYRDE